MADTEWLVGKVVESESGSSIQIGVEKLQRMGSPLEKSWRQAW